MRASPYTPALYERLLAIAPGRSRALDLGCGPGKVARVLADHFDAVVALDPSAPMIDAGAAADAGASSQHCLGAGAGEEDYESADGFDLVTAGGSIHWPDAARALSQAGALDDDAGCAQRRASLPASASALWHVGVDHAFMNRWLPSVGRPLLLEAPLDDRGARKPRRMRRGWKVVGHERFTGTFQQGVEDFVVGQHRPRSLGTSR